MTVYKGNVDSNVIFRKGDDGTQLTSVGGYLYVSDGAQCDLPQLTSVGGYPIATAEQGYARLQAIAREVLADPKKLDMGRWHNESRGCGTSHCIAGWAVHLDPGGYDLEKALKATHNGAETHSIVMRSKTGTVRRITSRFRDVGSRFAESRD